MRHKLLFDEAEALLSSRLAAFLLEPKQEDAESLDIATCMEFIAAARRSTGGSKAVIDKLLEQATKIWAGNAVNIKLVTALREILTQLRDDELPGDPAVDWLRVKSCLRGSGRDELIRCALQLDYFLAFRRGKRISAALSDEWLRDGAYTHARVALDGALAQEHLTPAWPVCPLHRWDLL